MIWFYMEPLKVLTYKERTYIDMLYTVCLKLPYGDFNFDLYLASILYKTCTPFICKFDDESKDGRLYFRLLILLLIL